MVTEPVSAAANEVSEALAPGWDNFVSLLDEIAIGLLGIFIIAGVIIGITALLNKFTSKKK